MFTGNDALVRELVAQAWPLVDATPYRAPGVGASESVVVMRAGFTNEWRARHARNAPTARILAARLTLDEQFVDAAEAWARVSPYDEAVARLEAARSLAGTGRRAEAEVQLDRGLAFFRAVGARRVIELAEAPLRAAAAAE